MWAKLKEALNERIDRLQEQLTPEKVVKALSLPIAAGAGALVAWLGTHAPGVPTPSAEVAAGLFALGVGSAIALLNKIIDGWQQRDRRDHDAEEAARQRASEERIAAIAQAPELGDKKSRSAIAELITTPPDTEITGGKVEITITGGTGALDPDTTVGEATEQ